MSWSLSFGPVSKEKLDEAIDAAVASGQPADLPGMADDVATAKSSLKNLGRRVKRPMVSGAASGHCLQTSDTKFASDSLSVQVYGSEPPKEG